jgi:hypothetical protein
MARPLRVCADLDGFGNSGPGWPAELDGGEHRHRYQPILMLPIMPGVALCLCCPWIGSGGDLGGQAAAHRDATSHAVIAGPGGC